MNSKIKEALEQYDEDNFEEVLEIIDGADAEGLELELGLVIKFDALTNLKRYDESLEIIDALIEKNPHSLTFWLSKARNHYFAGDGENAAVALREAEGLIDVKNVDHLVRIAQTSKLIRNYEMALKYCDMALEIDENCEDALREKSMVANHFGDNEMMNECADRLLEMYKGSDFEFILPLMLKFFAGNYKGCLEIANDSDALAEEHVEMIKMGLYNRMCEDLNVRLGMSQPLELTVDEALDLMFKYHYEGIARGQYKGVLYCMVEGED